MNIKPFVLHTLLLLSLTSPCLAQAQDRGQKLSAKEINVLIDSLANALNRRYIYPDKAALMISSIKGNFKSGVYNNAEDRTGLGRQLHKDLQQVYKDGHLEIVYDPQLARDIETPRIDTAANRRAYNRELHDAKENNFAFRKAEILPGNIGYIRWDGFYGFVDEARPTLNGAFQFVSNTRALIIDMRNNSGGSPEMVLQMQCYFFQQKTPMNYIIDRNNDTMTRWADPGKTDFKLNMPVYILTSHGTFSGAEDFTYGLKYANRAIVVGDTTGGGAHPTSPFSIGQGFIAFIPTLRSANIAAQADWEGTGIWPDVAVPSDQALSRAQGLIYAALLLKETDEREKSILRWNLISNENKALLAKQMQHDSIAISKEELIKYCGEYNPSDPNTSTTTLFIVLNGNHICRHLSPGTSDIRLIPLSDSKFIYDDDSGRTIDFVKDKNGAVLSMILSSQDGAFTKNKKK